MLGPLPLSSTMSTLPTSRSTSSLHPLRRLRYKQLFHLLPLTPLLSTLDDPTSEASISLREGRNEYFLKKGVVMSMERGGRRESFSSFRTGFEEGDPVFFSSASNLQTAQTIVQIYTHESTLNPSLPPPTPFSHHLAITLYYILSTSEIDDSVDFRIPDSAIAEEGVESDCYWIFREIYPCNPSLLSNPAFSLQPFYCEELFLPVGDRKYLLGVWDGLFEEWCHADFFKTSRKDRESIKKEVYYNSSDPLASVEKKKNLESMGSRCFEAVGVPPLFAEVVAAYALALGEFGTDSFTNLKELYESPAEVFFAARVLDDPKIYLSVVGGGELMQGSLGMMLRHDPLVGLIVNSFQGEGGQAQASGNVKVGDVLVAVNGWRLDKGTDAHKLVGLITQLPRPISITFVHADVSSKPVKVTNCLSDGYKLPLMPGEKLIECRQCQMKASTFGLAEAAGGMAGIGINPSASSALQHPMTSTRTEGPVTSAWLPGVALVSGALFVTNYRIVFHRARGDGFCVDRSVKKQSERRRRESRSPTRSSTASPTLLARTSSMTSTGTNGTSNTSGTEMDNEDEEMDDDFEITVQTVLKVESFTEHEYGIVKVDVPTLGVITKDGRAVKFVMPFQLGNSHESCKDVGRSLMEVCFDENRSNFNESSNSMKWGGEWKQPGAGDHDPRHEVFGQFHLLHKENIVKAGDNLTTTAFGGKYSLLKEYERLGLLNEGTGLRCLNSGIDLAPVAPDTYPNEILVPQGMTNDELKRVVGYRSRGRIPAVVYQYPITKATISRSSQPLVGLGKNRCEEDEKLLARIMNVGHSTDNPKGRLYIMDARKKTAATGNKIMGKGTEDTKNYVGTVMLHMNIGNIHAVRESEAGVWDLCRPSSAIGAAASWHGKLESTGWLTHVHRVLAASLRCAAIISQEGTSVLVHCSDGWDRTAQMTSLAQLVLDPYYRSFAGFKTLIEKEWFCFGHKFEDRNGRGSPKGGPKDEERSPIFLLFIDCVWQVVKQQPNEFEFNTEFLIALLDQQHSGKSGSFLYNSKTERTNANLDHLAFTVWDVLASFGMEGFTNESWLGEDGASKEPLIVSMNPKNIGFFEPYFMRFDSSLVGFQRWRTYY
ncbi:hypothetical protein TL16_g08575 [Triparma laevis f. inornata]|uniref:Phosphatidylinositol-3-phosphatase n=1 Tax=Triparma laevis f. inornata TaxID=1714386 RepID=A0A9W7B3M5_9STRA|nr:hypothetical protein TL16_g08575 [Triparma laevis f. inornata]